MRITFFWRQQYQQKVQDKVSKIKKNYKFSVACKKRLIPEVEHMVNIKGSDRKGFILNINASGIKRANFIFAKIGWVIWIFKFTGFSVLARVFSDEVINLVSRMAYVIAFSFSYNSSVINRNSKPFNPLLGETYELKNSNL